MCETVWKDSVCVCESECVHVLNNMRGHWLSSVHVGHVGGPCECCVQDMRKPMQATCEHCRHQHMHQVHKCNTSKRHKYNTSKRHKCIPLVSDSSLDASTTGGGWGPCCARCAASRALADRASFTSSPASTARTTAMSFCVSVPVSLGLHTATILHTSACCTSPHQQHNDHAVCRTGFVTADGRGTAHGLSCPQVAHEVVVCQHALHAVGKADGDGQRKALRNGDHLKERGACWWCVRIWLCM